MNRPKTDKEERLIVDAIDWFDQDCLPFPATMLSDRALALARAVSDVIKERNVPPEKLTMIRDSPDGELLPGFDRTTGRRIVR